MVPQTMVHSFRHFLYLPDKCFAVNWSGCGAEKLFGIFFRLSSYTRVFTNELRNVFSTAGFVDELFLKKIITAC